MFEKRPPKTVLYYNYLCQTTEVYEKKDLDKNTHNKMEFYQQIRKNSQIVLEAKKDARDAKVASDNALRVEWFEDNWTPLTEFLADEITRASDKGAFSAIVEASTKSFVDMTESALFENNNVYWSILGFITLISESNYKGNSIIKELMPISWKRKGYMDGFKISHAVGKEVPPSDWLNYPNQPSEETVVFNISWDP